MIILKLFIYLFTGTDRDINLGKIKSIFTGSSHKNFVDKAHYTSKHILAFMNRA